MQINLWQIHFTGVWCHQYYKREKRSHHQSCQGEGLQGKCRVLLVQHAALWKSASHLLCIVFNLVIDGMLLKDCSCTSYFIKNMIRTRRDCCAPSLIIKLPQVHRAKKISKQTRRFASCSQLDPDWKSFSKNTFYYKNYRVQILNLWYRWMY